MLWETRVFVLLYIWPTWSWFWIAGAQCEEEEGGGGSVNALPTGRRRATKGDRGLFKGHSSCMPGIPMCCVKVGPAESNERAFLTRATLNTHRQSLNPSVWCTRRFSHLNAFLCVLLRCDYNGQIRTQHLSRLLRCGWNSKRLSCKTLRPFSHLPKSNKVCRQPDVRLHQFLLFKLNYSISYCCRSYRKS